MPGLPQGCAQRYAPQAGHHVDPFGVRGLVDLWPANSTARMRPRPFPVGPAYNASEFNLFTNVSIVSLVRPPSPALRVARADACIDITVALLAGHADACNTCTQHYCVYRHVSQALQFDCFLGRHVHRTAWHGRV